MSSAAARAAVSSQRAMVAVFLVVLAPELIQRVRQQPFAVFPSVWRISLTANVIPKTANTPGAQKS